MALPESGFITQEEYFALDNDSEIRYEYVNGEIFAMAGASRAHNLITLNTSTSLNTQLRDKPCETYQSDMRVQTKPNSKYRYPDIVIVCGEPDFAETTPVSLTNPTLIIEVLSESTAFTDFDAKFSEYFKIDSVQEYVIISQDEVKVRVHSRNANGELRVKEAVDLNSSIDLASIGCVLELREVFRRIEFGESSE